MQSDVNPVFGWVEPGLGGRRDPSRPEPRSGERRPLLRALPGPAEPLSRLDGITVLVVDDNPDARAIISQMLEPLGARVLLARDGSEALGMLRNAAPDVILCDLLMPRMDGFELSERIRRDPRRARVPLVAVTALGSAPDYLQTWEAGFDAHISKPIDDRELASVVRLLARRGRVPPRPAARRRRPLGRSRPR